MKALIYTGAKAIIEYRLGGLDRLNTHRVSDGAGVFINIRPGGIADPKAIVIPAHDETEIRSERALN